MTNKQRAEHLAKMLQQKVVYDGMIVKVEEVLRAYQQAHPTWHVFPMDAGEQVFIGTQAGTGLWLDKLADHDALIGQ